MTEVLSKSEFARRRGVSAAAVSQWIANGKLGGAALVGEGRAARILVEEAERQLGLTRDPGQQLAQAALRPTASAALPLPAPAPRSAEDDHAARYQKARADSAEIDSERSRRRLAAEDGLYMVTADAAAAWAKELAEFLHAVEGWFPDLAVRLAAMAAAGQPMDAKSLTAALRRDWRALRQHRTDLARSARDALPELVPEAVDEPPAGDTPPPAAEAAPEA